MEDMKVRMYNKEKYLLFFTDQLSVYCKQYYNPFTVFDFKGSLGLPYYTSLSSVKEVDFSQLKHKTSFVPFQDPVQMDLSACKLDDNEEVKLAINVDCLQTDR